MFSPKGQTSPITRLGTYTASPNIRKQAVGKKIGICLQNKKEVERQVMNAVIKKHSIVQVNRDPRVRNDCYFISSGEKVN
jgi:hypothetical protein